MQLISAYAQHGISVTDEKNLLDLASFSVQHPREIIFQSSIPVIAGEATRDIKKTHVITLQVNPDLDISVAQAFDATVFLNVGYGDLITSLNYEKHQLKIKYTKAGGYSAKESFAKENVNLVSYSIDSIVIHDAANTPIPLLVAGAVNPVIAGPLKNILLLKQQLKYERYFQPDPDGVIVTQAIASNAEGYIKVSWTPLFWATGYDIEYMYLDNYGNEINDILLPDKIAYDFRSNSTRIRLTDTEYELPLVFERGYLLFRVRPFAYWGNHLDKIVTGRWSLHDDFSTQMPQNNASYSFYYTIAGTHENDKKNWQYSATFSENGKRKDIVKYLDGSFRERQIVTNLSTGKSLLIGETIYDYAGRPAIDVLPTPKAGQSFPNDHAPAISYQPALNLNTSTPGRPYSWHDFDTGNDCSIAPAAMSTDSGAGNYYSPRNVLFDANGVAVKKQMGFVPNAGGFPFIQKEYMPDNTGRIRRQSAAGEFLKLGNGTAISHELKFYYSTPSQQELDRIFGNDAGYARHFSKETKMDENGVTSVVYKNLKGNIVAAALAGVKPANMDAVELSPGIQDTIVVDIVDRQSIPDPVSATISSSYMLTITAPTDLNIRYRLMRDTLHYGICNQLNNLCYDCIYDLAVTITDDCGIIKWSKQAPLGTLTDLRKCDNTQRLFTTDTILPSLGIGTYKVSKVLSINKQAIDIMIGDYLSDTCWKNMMTAVKLKSCEPAACKLHDVVRDSNCEADINGVLLPDFSHLPVFDSTGESDCRIVTDTNYIGLRLAKMLNDLSPGGQYASYYGSKPEDIALTIYGYPLSVLNTNNQLRTKGNWRHPVTPYKNCNGTLILIDTNINGVPAKLRPENLNDWTQFVKYWKPSMAYSLLPYHPEYCYFEWCVTHKDYFEYSDKLQKTDTRAAAHPIYHDLFTDPTYATPDRDDPFLKGQPQLMSQMSDYMKNIKLLDSRPQAQLGATVPMFQAAAISSAGFGFPFDEQDLINYSKHDIYSDVFLEDDEWKSFRTFYLQARTRLLESVMKRQADSNCCRREHLNIGDPGCTPNSGCALYRDKFPVFASQQDAFHIIDTTGLSAGTAGDGKFGCGNCPASQKLHQFLNQTIVVNKFFRRTRLSGSLLSLIAGPTTDNVIGKQGKIFCVVDTLTIPGRLTATITGITIANDVVPIGTISLQTNAPATGFSWRRLLQFYCMKTGNSASNFLLTAIDSSGNDFSIDGNIDFVNVKSCATKPSLDFDYVPKEYTPLFLGLLEQVLKSNRHNIIPARVHVGRNVPSPLYPPGSDPVSFWRIAAAVPVTTGSFTIPIKTATDNTGIDAGIVIDRSGAACIDDFSNWKITDYSLQTATLQVDQCFETGKIKVIVQNRQQPQQMESFFVKFDGFSLGRVCYRDRSDSLCCVRPTAGYPQKEEPDCKALQILAHRIAEEARIDSLKHHLADSLRQLYVQHCLRSAESLTLTYVQSTYQFTLQYYDAAGNLVKTVPPGGIKLLNNDSLRLTRLYRDSGQGDPIFPAHTLATTYQYNSANSMVSVTSPDAGTIHYAYDELGRPVYSQNAVQYGSGFSARQASFILYDSLSRVIQTGQTHLPGQYPELPPLITYKDFVAQLSVNDDFKTDVFTTYYDNVPGKKTVRGGLDINIDSFHLRNLRNRAAATFYHRRFLSTDPYVHAFFYNYDIEGNVDTVLQDFRHLSDYVLPLNLCSEVRLQRTKKIVYDYDLISKKVKRVWYQPNQPDQFIHYYNYDADERLIAVKTSSRLWEDNRTLDNDITYQYYLHGPLARTEIGQEKVQGLDYAYTIQGWMKGLNSSPLNSISDIGRDGNNSVLKDAVGYNLHYFHGDYTPLGGKPFEFYPSIRNTDLDKDFTKNGLFNGDIHHINMSIDALENNEKTQAVAYHYDVLNRLRQARYYRPATAAASPWTNGGFIKGYQSEYHYDANGNILFLTRKNGAGVLIDSLSYGYNDTNNQLLSVHDKIGRLHPEDEDLDKNNTYTYDLSGRLKTETEGPAKPNQLGYTWTSFDKPLYIERNGINIDIAYNAMKERAWKYDGQTGTGNYYVRDLQGNPLAIYRFDSTTATLDQVPLNGSNRIGVWNARLDLKKRIYQPDQLVYTRGSKEYELNDYLGNILTTISDRRIPSLNGWTMDTLTANDYYPFGMLIRERAFTKATVQNYRYGFNRKENDNEVKGIGNQIVFDERIYDSRVGRFLIVDPMAAKTPGESPYSSMGNNPILNIDPNGNFAVHVHKGITMNAFNNSGLSKGFLSRFKTHLVVGATRYADYYGFAFDHHFDDRKNFSEVQATWTKLNNDIDSRINDIGSGNKMFGGSDVERLGINVHNVQDFYSHSNYVELYVEYYKAANNGAMPTEVPIYTDGLKIEGFKNLMERTTTDANGKYQGLNTGTFSVRKFIKDKAMGTPDTDPNSHEQMNKDEVDTPEGKLAEDVSTRHTTEILKRVNEKK